MPSMHCNMTTSRPDRTRLDLMSYRDTKTAMSWILDVVVTRSSAHYLQHQQAERWAWDRMNGMGPDRRVARIRMGMATAIAHLEATAETEAHLVCHPPEHMMTAVYEGHQLMVHQDVSPRGDQIVILAPCPQRMVTLYRPGPRICRQDQETSPAVLLRRLLLERPEDRM